MTCKIEIAKRKKIVSTDHIEDTLWNNLQSKKYQKNSIVYIPCAKFPELNEFYVEFHSITFNDIPVSSSSL